MTKREPTEEGTFFQRFLLPSFALKGVIIGGGYATGRELTEYFLSQGPVGALLAMLVATIMWSIVAAITFALAHQFRTYDYRAFISQLLGRASIAFEICYLLFSILLLAVFGAAAGEVSASLFATPAIIGTLALAICITVIAGLGEKAVETMFKYVSALLYTIYAIFLVIALSRFGERIDAVFEIGGVEPGWPISGLTYGIYNIVAAVMILPVLRHLGSRRDALIAGAIAGPLAIVPALAFLIAMVGFFPAILSEALPSDYILQRMGSPAFRFAFQIMVFGALLESGVGVIHALNERAIAFRYSRKGVVDPSRWFRPALTVSILAGCMFIANRIGLVDLIASGYRFMAIVFFVTFVVPLLTIGTVKLKRHSQSSSKQEGTAYD
ncbi:hypothetical protein [Parasphingorhabdus sp.]|uniref:YkvI family membrane protein n=1 Tax=Parasphingorhabdus sp. TaxID=2709688 RepID=UPI003A90D2E4